MRSSKTFVWKC